MQNSYDLPESEKRITSERLKGESADFQIEVMRTWFYQNYQDPVHECPYNGREDGYQYVYGGPYDALEELSTEFGEMVDDDIIEELASELNEECSDWSGISMPEFDDDDYFFNIAGTVVNPHNEFISSVGELRSMISMEIPNNKNQQMLLSMIFTNAITLMEVFLSENFIGKIENNPYYLRKFVEGNKEFKDEKLSLSDVFKRMDGIEKYAKEHLIGLLWHNLPKIKTLYKSTFDIDFPSPMDHLIKATHIRHDLIHRAGKTKDGVPIVLCEDDVIGLIDGVESFVMHITNAEVPEF